jgi:glycerol-3-phosphate dehydrogenase
VSEAVDVLIIGGGIVGAGVARDAAMRGLRTLLVDKHDFAFGTSSRSSRLLHGGIRYLAQGRIGLVREASTEKMIIHRIAPHLAQPLPFFFPTRRGTEWKQWKLAIGVKIYDLLCGKRNLGKSTTFSKDAALQVMPGLNPENLTGAVRYYDGLTNDARLVLDTLRSAQKHGATLRNYVGVTSTQQDGSAWRCVLDDGTEVVAKTIINSAGPWAMQFPPSRVKLRLTKGVHLVIDRAKLPVNDAVVMTEGSRILFAIPWGQRVILGTTDTDYSGPIELPVCETRDADYILGVVNATFLQAKIVTADIISTWAGLRPLIADPNGKPSDISRRHEIHMTQSGWFDVAGGKLTTYRLMAQQTVDKIQSHIQSTAPKDWAQRIRACETHVKPLLDPGEVQFSGIVPTDISRAAVEHFCNSEWAVHLDDVMIRRSSWKHYHRDRFKIAEDVATWMAEIFGWSSAKRDEELKRYLELPA